MQEMKVPHKTQLPKTFTVIFKVMLLAQVAKLNNIKK